MNSGTSMEELLVAFGTATFISGEFICQRVCQHVLRQYYIHYVYVVVFIMMTGRDGERCVFLAILHLNEGLLNH